MNKTLRFISIAAVLLLTSCGSDTSSGGTATATSYKDTKSMVMDILKSDDGRRAVQSAVFGLEDGTAGGAGGSTGGGAGGGTSGGSSGGTGGGSSGGGGGMGAAGMGAARFGATGIKTLAVADAQQLQLAVKDVLTDQQNSAFLHTLMTDPRFAGDFAKAVQKENKQLMKDLMKDPEYQKLHLDAMKNPEYQKLLIDTMRSMQYRQYVMNVIQESMQSPLFKVEMINMLKKAIEQGTAAQPPAGGAKEIKAAEKAAVEKAVAVATAAAATAAAATAAIAATAATIKRRKRIKRTPAEAGIRVRKRTCPKHDAFSPSRSLKQELFPHLEEELFLRLHIIQHGIRKL
ncbi:spore germination lipoprotein GerD [Gordoniibacillus kamchatkensis]|uniref:spore germination lipoprotein GerD n=1 Tax=Gordoniibacillus kamchatkensis TaxID=1590651 RepID=UPI000698EA33|nr:spore germination lipoprotein GerD [Paenibacillus sp. VKM B-2647]